MKLFTLALMMFVSANASAQDFGRDRGGRDRAKEEVITCMSKDNRPASCQASGEILQVNIIQQVSKAPCIEGYSYSFSGSRLFVNQGCRAQFAVKVRSQGGGYGSGTEIRCESANFQYISCRTGERVNSVQLMRQISKSACIQGMTFGVLPNGRGIWVDRGCAGVFYADRW